MPGAVSVLLEFGLGNVDGCKQHVSVAGGHGMPPTYCQDDPASAQNLLMRLLVSRQMACSMQVAAGLPGVGPQGAPHAGSVPAVNKGSESAVMHAGSQGIIPRSPLGRRILILDACQHITHQHRLCLQYINLTLARLSRAGPLGHSRGSAA